MPPDEHEIVLHNDGTWDPLPPKKEEHVQLQAAPAASNQVDMLSLDDSDNDTESEEKPHTKDITPNNEDDCVITLDSDSEDEAIALPLKKRARIDNAGLGGDSSPELICLDDDDD